MKLLKKCLWAMAACILMFNGLYFHFTHEVIGFMEFIISIVLPMLIVMVFMVKNVNLKGEV